MSAYMIIIDESAKNYPDNVLLPPGSILPPADTKVYWVKVRDSRDPGSRRLMAVGLTTGRKARTGQWPWKGVEAEVDNDMLLVHEDRMELPSEWVPDVPLREGLAVVEIGDRQDEEMFEAWVLHPPVVRNDAMAEPPVNAWMVMGTEVSFPQPDEVRDSWMVPVDIWTAPKHVQLGDLLFIYFMSPVKAIQFAARAASDAIFLPESGR